MAAPVAVERAGQPLSTNDFPEAKKAAGRPFLFNETHVVVFVGGIVHGDDQVPHLTRHPFVPAAVLVDHHPRQRHTLPLLAVRSFLLAFLDQTSSLQVLLHPAVAAFAAIPPVPVVKVPYIPATVPSAVPISQCNDFIDRRSPVRHLFQSPVDQTLQPVGFKARLVAPETSLAHAQYRCRFRLRQPPCVPSFIRFFKSHLPDLL
jgi:hypothetical protein